MSLDKITSVKVPTLEMYVTKRNGQREEVSFDKVLNRIKAASKGLDVNATIIAQKTLARIYNGVSTTELDELSARLAISLASTHPDYGTLAAQIAVSNHQRNTSASFCDVMKLLSQQIHPRTGETFSTISPEFVGLLEGREAIIDAAIVHERDFLFDYFGFKTLEKQYLLKDSNGNVVERPQYMYMRVALALWGHLPTLDRAFETYELLSTKRFTHATPTLFNAGMPRQQCSSCYLIAMDSDTVTGIYKTLGDCAQISKYAGGIGLHIHNIRAKGSIIRGTNGVSNGIVPMLRVFNNTARYIDQCFTPDTLVYTDKGIKLIEDISITDKVLTSKGIYKNVIKPVRHEYNGKMLDIQIKNGSESVRVTPEHQIFALKGQKKGINFNIIANRLNKKIVSPEFVDANELEVGDFVVFPIPKYEYDISHITEEDCRFYGILIGDGSISTKTSSITLSTITKKDTYDFVKDYLDKRGIHYTNVLDEETHVTKFVWSTSNPSFKFTRSQLYDINNEILVKNIEPSFLHLPIKKIIQLLKGIIETDGCIGDKEVTLEMSSFNVIESVRYILLRLGALSSGYSRNRIGNVSSYKNITTRRETYVVRVPRIKVICDLFPESPKSSFFSFLVNKNYIYSRIENITEIEYNGTVHDFEIDDPHDYTVAHLGIAHNGGGKRNGSFAIYLEPWHADIEDFLMLKRNTGSEEERARDLFYAMWMPDLFMERVEADAEWTLFCPAEAPGLADVWGPEFKELYERYEREGKGRATVSAQKLWFKILDSQIETGTPYLVYKDAANAKSNQQNVGTIKSSNLCSEIIQYSDSTETAVCNLASINLATFVDPKKRQFNFDELRRVTAITIRNLNRVIDINYYPTPETEKSNMRHRPVGLGIQGLADVFAMMRMPWESEKAADLNQRIFEHMYYAAVQQSAIMAQEDGSYDSFTGSPASTGKLQPDLWLVQPLTELDGSLDWGQLRQQAAQGLRNSLLLAPMPTASTSQICGSNECFEPFTSNIYTRRTIAGEFIVINKYLMNDLIKYQLWSEELKQKIIALNGSIQEIEEIPRTIRELYKTSYEIKQRTLIDLAAARGAFICQSQSLNLFVLDATYSKLTSMHFYAWRKGLKTGIYYLRTKAPVMAQKFTVDPTLLSDILADKKQREEDQRKGEEGCLMCSG
jgi:ribonucleoside-diphosphate reductase alpha chain